MNIVHHLGFFCVTHFETTMTSATLVMVVFFNCIACKTRTNVVILVFFGVVNFETRTTNTMLVILVVFVVAKFAGDMV